MRRIIAMKNKIARRVMCLFLMLTILIPTMVPFTASAVVANSLGTSSAEKIPDAAPMANDNLVDIDTANGTNYSLFNSGATGSGRAYNSYSNYDEASYKNGGYDLYANQGDANEIIQLGLPFFVGIDIDERATVNIYAYDVDEYDTYHGHSGNERDYIYLVNETTQTRTLIDGYLSGQNATWNNTSLTISPDLFEVGNTYHFELDVNCTCSNYNCQYWVVYVRTVNLIINGSSEPPVTPQTGIENAEVGASISASGLITANLTANAYAKENYTLEYKAVCTSNSAQYGGKEYSVTIPTTPTVFDTTFQLETGALRGTYEITVFIKDYNGNVVTTRTAVASYGYSAVSYNSNGGSQNLPTDGATYSNGNTVTVKFDYVPSKYGYVFLGWSTDRNASEPMYTKDGTNTFVIGSNDVTLYAIWAAEAMCEHNGSHVWVTEVAATCLEQGTGYYVCANCGEYISAGYEPALGHDYKIVRTDEPTCTQDGCLYFECQRDGCNATKKQSTPAPGHNFNADNICMNCGFERITHTHNYTSTTYPATCTTMGYTEFVCECGYSYRADYIEILGHLWNDGEVTVAKTCTTSGTMHYTCQRCNDSYDREIPASHEWSETVTVPATCTTDGELVRVCYSCNATEVEVIPAAHAWDDGIVITEPDCENAGEKTCTCQTCGVVENFVIERLGHSYVNGVCTRCGEGFLGNVVQGDHPEYGMYFEIEDILSNYGPDIINEYGLLLDYNQDARLDKVAIYLTQDGTMWRRCIACTGENIQYATYVPYLSYGDDIKYTGLNSDWINIFRLSENADGIWCYSNYATIGVNLADYQGRLLLSLYDIGQAGTKTRIFDDLGEMIEWLNEGKENACKHEAGRWITVNEPTYGSEGLRVKRCVHCNAIMESEILPKLNEAIAKVATNVEYVPVSGEIVYTVIIENCALANALALVPQFDTTIFDLISSSWTVDAIIQDIEEGTGRAISTWAEATDVNRAVFTFTLKAKAGCESTNVGCMLKAEINKEQVEIFVLSDDIKVCDHAETIFVMVDEHHHNVVCACCGYIVEEEIHVYDNNIDIDCNCCGYERRIRGDVDGDKDIDHDDSVYLVYNIFFGDSDYPVTDNCDFDGDGNVTTDDSIYLLYFIYFGAEQYPLH
jgi:uncharacterized repeat protein (TIGR02543 family)